MRLLAIAIALFWIGISAQRVADRLAPTPEQMRENMDAQLKALEGAFGGAK